MLLDMLYDSDNVFIKSITIKILISISYLFFLKMQNFNYHFHNEFNDNT